jgi:hypothetical protein
MFPSRYKSDLLIVLLFILSRRIITLLALSQSFCCNTNSEPIPVTARSKAVCGRLVAGVAGSNTARSTDVCLLCCPV